MPNASTESPASRAVDAQGTVHSTENTDALEPWLRLMAIEGLGGRSLLALIAAWNTPEAVLQASPSKLVDSGCSRRLAEAITRGPDSGVRRDIDRELAWIRRTKTDVRSLLDASYPARLRMIDDPPPLLYISGTLEQADELSVAVVGARRATAAGRALTEELSTHLAECGLTVVSGLARGIDAAAHRGALAAGGRTIAVLGCGIDLTYPPEHERLRCEIQEHGAVVSELPVGTPPLSHHFPRRNRIISGLSLGVVVTEAAMDSGSLITARLAAEQGREVFAIPGFVKHETSRGTNALLKEGAALVEGAEDVVEALWPQLDDALRARVKRRPDGQASPADLGIQERLVYDALSYEPKTVDRIVEDTGLTVGTVMATLLSLELRRLARQLSGQRYLRT